MRANGNIRNMDKYIIADDIEPVMGYEKCIKEYMNYYDTRSKWYKKIYYTGTIIKLIAVASVPIMELAVQSGGEVNWQVVGAGAIALFCESLLDKIKAKEKYLSYRNVCEKLSSEQRMYKSKCDRYSGKHANSKYVKRVEGIIAAENKDWKLYMEKQD